MTASHASTVVLERAGYATDALRVLLLADAEPDERALIDGTLRDLGQRLRQGRWRTLRIKRAALRLAAAVESLRADVLES